MVDDGGGAVNQVALLGDFAGGDIASADHQKAIEDFGNFVSFAVVGSFATMIASDDDQPIFLVISGSRFQCFENAADMAIGTLDGSKVLGNRWVKSMAMAGDIDLPDIAEHNVRVLFFEFFDRSIGG